MEKKQYVVSEQIAVEAEDAEQAVKMVIDGGGSVISLTATVRGAVQPRPAQAQQTRPTPTVGVTPNRPAPKPNG